MAKKKEELKKNETQVEVKISEVIDYMRIMGSYFPVLHDVVSRKIISQAASENGIRVSTKELQKAADAFRILKHLHKKEEMNKWLGNIGVSIDKFEEFLETNILISKFKDFHFDEAAKKKYILDPRVLEFARNVAHDDWLKENLKA